MLINFVVSSIECIITQPPTTYSNDMKFVALGVENQLIDLDANFTPRAANVVIIGNKELKTSFM